MMKKLSFVLGAAAGYVLGARAGRKRYEQIVQQAQRIWQSDTVQHRVEQTGEAVGVAVKRTAPRLGGLAAGGVEQVAKFVGRSGKGGSSSPQAPSGTAQNPAD